jgi:hypothetical protein
METVCSILTVLLFGGLIIWELSIRLRIGKFLVKLIRRK